MLRRSTQAYRPPDASTVELIVKNLRRTHLSLCNVQDLARELEDSGNQLTREQERTLSCCGGSTARRSPEAPVPARPTWPCSRPAG